MHFTLASFSDLFCVGHLSQDIKTSILTRSVRQSVCVVIQFCTIPFFSYYPCSFGSSKLALHVFCFWFAYSSFSLFGGYLLILLLEFLASTYSVEMNVFSPDITRIAEQRLAQFYIRFLAIIIFAIFHK